MKKLLKNNHADISAVTTSVAIIVMIVISIVIVYNIATSLNMGNVDDTIAEQIYGYSQTNWDAGGSNASRAAHNATMPGANATDEVLSHSETFYTLAPLIVIVLIAVVILGYVMGLVRKT